MQFNLELAREDNLSDNQILDILKQGTPGFNFDLAARDQLSLDDMVGIINKGATSAQDNNISDTSGSMPEKMVDENIPVVPDTTKEPAKVKPEDSYLDLISKYSAENNLDNAYTTAVIRRESAFKPNAISYTGAYGLMQLQPATARELGLNVPDKLVELDMKRSRAKGDVSDPTTPKGKYAKRLHDITKKWEKSGYLAKHDDRANPELNVQAGTKYLNQHLVTFNDDIRLATAAYNAGAGNVKKYGDVPPFKETQGYVDAIIAELSERQQQVPEELVGEATKAKAQATVPQVSEPEDTRSTLQKNIDSVDSASARLLSGASKIPAFVVDTYLEGNNWFNKAINHVAGTKLQTNMKAPEVMSNNAFTKWTEGIAERKSALKKYRDKGETLTTLIGRGNADEIKEYLYYSTLEQGPQIAAVVAGQVAGVPAHITLGLLGGTAGAEQLDEWRDKISAGEKVPPKSVAVLNAWTHTVAEYGFEQLGTYEIAKPFAQMFKTIAKKSGKEVADKVVRGTFKNVAKGMLGGFTEEAKEELATELTTAFVDKISGIRPDLTWKDIVSQAFESFVIGGLSGAPLGGAGGIGAAQTQKQVDKEAKAQEILSNLRKMKEDQEIIDTENSYAGFGSVKEYVKETNDDVRFDVNLTPEELFEVNKARGNIIEAPSELKADDPNFVLVDKKQAEETTEEAKETTLPAERKTVEPGEFFTVDGQSHMLDAITEDGQVVATTTETVKEDGEDVQRQRTSTWESIEEFEAETGVRPVDLSSAFEGAAVAVVASPKTEDIGQRTKQQDAAAREKSKPEEKVETFGVTDENLKKAQDIVVDRLDDVEVVGVQEGFMVDGEVRHEPRLMFNFIGEGKNKGQTFDLPLTATQADIDAEIGKKVEIKEDAPESPVEAPQGAVKSGGTQSTREVVKAPVSPPSTPQNQIEETTEVTPEQTDEVAEEEVVPKKVQDLPTSEDDATITISKIIDTLGNKITKERYTDTTNEELTGILKKQFPSATETIENTPDFSEQFKEAAILKRVKVELSKETKAQTKQGVHTRGRQSKFVTGTDEQILNSLIKRFPEAEELMRSIPDFTNKIRTLAQTKTFPKKITQKAKEALLPEVIETTKETKDSEDITTQTAKDQQSEQQEIDKSEKKQQVVVEQLRPVADESVVPYDAKKHDKLLEQFYDRVSKRKVSYLERVGDTDFVQLTPHGEKYFQDRKDRVGDKIVRGEQAHDIIDRAQYQGQDNIDADEEMEVYDLDSEQFDSGERFEDNSTNVSEEEGTTQTQKFHNSVIKQLPLGSAIRIFTEETTIAPSGKVLNDFSKQGDGAKGAVLMSADKKQALVFIRPSANSLREAVTAIHEMWGHFGKRKVFKAFPAIAKKWEEVFESDRNSDFTKKLEHDYTPKKAEIRKSLEKAGIYTEATLNEKFEDLLFEEWTARRIGEVGSKFFDKKGNIVESRIADKQNVLVRVYEAIKEYLHSVFGTGISDTQLTQMTRELVSTMPNVSVNETLKQMKQHYATTRESVAQKEASKPKTALRKQVTKHLESINKKINNKEEFAELSNPEQNELHGQQNILNRLAAQGSDQSIVDRAQAELRKANDTIKKHEDTLKTGRMTHPAEAGVVDDTTMEELYGQVDVLNRILKGDVAKAQKLPTTESSEASEVSFQDTEQQSKLSDEESVFEIIASAEQAQDKKFAQAQLVKFARKVLTNADIRKDFLDTVVNIESLESPTFDRAISRAYSLAEAGKKKRSITKLQNIIKKDLNTKSMSHLSKIHKGLIKQLLGQFDIKKLSSKKRTELIRKELELVDVDPELVDEGIKNEIARLDKTPLSDLDLNEIENITKQIQGILFVDKVQKDLISFERKATIEEETAKTQGAIKKYVSSKKGDKKLRTLANIDGEIGKITYNDLTKKSQGAAARTANWYKYYASDIQTIANELDGWEAGDITKILYTEINDGYSKMLEMNQLRSGFFKQRLLGAVKNLDKYSSSFVTSFDRLAAKVTGKDVLELTETTMGNRKIELTHDQRIAMYLGSLNQDNLRHMINGGLYVGNIVDPIKVSLRDIKELRNSLTKEERLIAETIHEYLNVHQRKAINEVSNKKDGYDIADVDNYFPMQSKYTDVEKVRPDINKPSDMATMYRYGVSPENVGVLKTRTQASTPLVLEGAFEAVMRTSNLTNKYIGMAIPLRNATAVYNSGLKRTMMDNGLEQQTKEIDYYLEQLYGGRFLDQETKVAGKLFNMFVVGKLAGRMFPSLKQVASIPVLWTEIDVKYYNPLDLAQYKRVWRDIEANSPELFTRRSAGFSREFGELMKSAQARKDVTGKKSFTDMAMMPITFMDSIAIASAWSMSEREISATTNLKKGSEEYTQAVRRRAEEVVSKTQPTYHMTQRPQLMGNHPIKKIINMFGTQRNKNFQMTRRAFGEIGKGNISKGISSLVYIYGLQAASVMLIDNLRAFMLGKIDSDDEDPWWKKTMGELLGNALGNFIGIDRVVKVLLGNRYSATIDIPGLEALAEIHGAVKAATEITGGTKTTTRGGRKRTKRLKSSEIAKKQQAVVKHVLKAASSVGAPGLAVSEFIDATNVALKEFE